MTTAALPLIPFITPLLVWLAFPGGGELWPLLGIALVPLLQSLEAVRGRRALATGYLVGLLFYGLQLYWLVTVLAKYGGLPMVIAVPAFFLLISYMALYTGIFSWCASLLLRHASAFVLIFAIPFVWVGLDWLRSFLFSGFPWMDLGYGLAGVPLLIQSADLFGHHFLTFLIVLVNIILVLLLRDSKKRTFNLLPVAVSIVLVGLVLCYSVYRSREIRGQLVSPDVTHLNVGVVQGNIDQSLKWSPEQQQQTVDTYLESSAELVRTKGVDLVVWPETALPFYPTVYPGMNQVYRAFAANGAGVLTGVPWYEIVNVEKRLINYYNSAQLYTPEGEIAGSYYKSHLVPFGEYVPLKRFLPFLAPLVEAVGDFKPGTVGKTLEFGDARIGVLICFESIFPDIGRKWVKNGANVLVNLTNDAWYGKSSAPYHSMSMTVLRAVENRRSIVRSANTGVSGFIDPLGQVREPSKIFVQWKGADNLPLVSEQTIFVRWGYMFAPFCFACGAVLLALVMVRGKRDDIR